MKSSSQAEKSAAGNPAASRRRTPADEAEAWRERIATGYGIDDPGGQLLLNVAATSLARLIEAQRAIAKDGAFQTDRNGVVKAHPACALERDSRAGLLAALRQLHLDIEPLRDGPGRPPGR